MEVLRLKRVEVTDAGGVEFIAAKWGQGGCLHLFVLLAVHFLRDGKPSLKSRWAQTHRNTHTERDTLSHTSEAIWEFLPFILELPMFCRVYTLNTAHLNVNIRSVGV